MMKIYVASSWRTERHDEVVKALTRAGHTVYNYREPASGGHGFSWEQIDPTWQSWDAEQYCNALYRAEVQKGFWTDFDAMTDAAVFVGVEPFGVSASLELGWAAGRGKKTILLIDDKNIKPELMTKMLTFRVTSIHELIDTLEAIRK